MKVECKIYQIPNFKNGIFFLILWNFGDNVEVILKNLVVESAINFNKIIGKILNIIFKKIIYVMPGLHSHLGYSSRLWRDVNETK